MAHFWHQSSWIHSRDCHVSITFQSFLPGLVCSFLRLSSACLTPSQGHSVNAFLLPSHHVPSSTSLNCFAGNKCICSGISMTSSVIFICCALYSMSQIYGMESLTDTTRLQTVWGSLTLPQLLECTYSSCRRVYSAHFTHYNCLHTPCTLRCASVQ